MRPGSRIEIAVMFGQLKMARAPSIANAS